MSILRIVKVTKISLLQIRLLLGNQTSSVFFFEKFSTSSLGYLQKFENYTLLLDGFPVRVCPVLPFSLKIRWIWCFSSSLTQSSSGFWLSVIQRFFYNNNKRASQRSVLICQPLLSYNHCFDEWPLLSVKIDPALFYRG